VPTAEARAFQAFDQRELPGFFSVFSPEIFYLRVRAFVEKGGWAVVFAASTVEPPPIRLLPPLSRSPEALARKPLERARPLLTTIAFVPAANHPFLRGPLETPPSAFPPARMGSDTCLSSDRPT